MDEPFPFAGPDPNSLPSTPGEMFRRGTRASQLLEAAEHVNAERRSEIGREILMLGQAALPSLYRCAAGRQENAAVLSRSLLRLLVPDEIGRQLYSGLLREKDGYRVEQGAILISKLFYPNLPVERVLRDLDALGKKAGDFVCAKMGIKRQSLKQAAGNQTIEVIKELGEFWREEGFQGSTESYYSDRNSYIPDVLEKHTGLPIALSIVYLALARRVQVNAEGVGLPGHFIVRVGVGPREEGRFMLIDPFNGARPVDLDECRIRVESLGQPFLAEEHLKAVSPRDILTRMCNNLVALFDHQKKTLEAERVVTVIAHLQPRDPIPLLLRAERRLRRGERKMARLDFEKARALDPNGPVGRTAAELLRRMGFENPFQ